MCDSLHGCGGWVYACLTEMVASQHAIAPGMVRRGQRKRTPPQMFDMVAGDAGDQTHRGTICDVVVSFSFLFDAAFMTGQTLAVDAASFDQNTQNIFTTIGVRFGGK